MDASTTVLWVLIVGVPIALLLGVGEWQKRRKERRENAERAEANRVEAEAYFARVKATGGIDTIETDLILGGDEHAVLADEATLFETRAVRVYGGGGTSIKGVHLGAGVSESRDRLRRIDSGRLVLTTKRLVFDGSTENRSIKLADILSATALLDAIEVSTQRRGKSLLFAVPNPLIWAPAIKAVASRR